MSKPLCYYQPISSSTYLESTSLPQSIPPSLLSNILSSLMSILIFLAMNYLFHMLMIFKESPILFLSLILSIPLLRICLSLSSLLFILVLIVFLITHSHSMLTRAKVGTFKPKTFLASINVFKCYRCLKVLKVLSKFLNGS